jgi:hypothetical protein
MKPTIPRKNSRRNRLKTKIQLGKNQVNLATAEAEAMKLIWDAYEKVQERFPDSISARKGLGFEDVTTEMGNVVESGRIEIRYTFLLMDKNHTPVIPLQEGRTIKSVVEINGVPALNRVRYVLKIREVRRPFRLGFPFYVNLPWPKPLWRKAVVSILTLPRTANFPAHVLDLNNDSQVEGMFFTTVED